MQTIGAACSYVLSHFDELPDLARVRIPVVAVLYTCSLRAVRNRVVSGDIPPPEKIGDVPTWVVEDLHRFFGA